MTLITSADCKQMTSSEARSCSKCDYSTKEVKKTAFTVRKMQVKNILASLIIILLLGGIITGCSFSKNDVEITKDFTTSIQKYGNILEDFSEGLLLVSRDGKYGFIDQKGKEVIPCKYDYANSFSEDLAVVCIDGKYGAIDKQGNEIIPCKYQSTSNKFSEGLLGISHEMKHGYINKKGEEVIPCKYTTANFFSDGLAVVGYKIDHNTKYGIIDKEGNEIIPCKYKNMSYSRFSEGLLAVCREEKYGFIDKHGNEIIPCKYDYAYGFSEGMAVVTKKDGQSAVIDKHGNEILPFDCNGRIGFSEGLLIITKSTGKKINVRRVGIVDEEKYGFIDKQGKEIVSCKYDYAYLFSEGLASVQLNGKYGFIDKQGNEVIPCIYEDANPTGFSNGLARVRCEGRWGFVDKKGNNTFPQYSTNDAILKAISVEDSELKVISVIGSNAIKDQASNNYNPSNLLDNNISTAWATQFTGNGNDFLKFTLKAKRLNKIVITNGYRKNSDSYWNNSRAKLIEITVDGDLAWDGEIDDDNYASQTIQLEESYSNVENVNITIYSIYEGRKWNDLCLSEIKFYGIK